MVFPSPKQSTSKEVLGLKSTQSSSHGLPRAGRNRGFVLKIHLSFSFPPCTGAQPFLGEAALLLSLMSLHSTLPGVWASLGVLPGVWASLSTWTFTMQNHHPLVLFI